MPCEDTRKTVDIAPKVKVSIKEMCSSDIDAPAPDKVVFEARHA